MYKKHILIVILVSIGLASAVVVEFDQVKATAYGTGEPAGLSSNMTGNMTGKNSTSGEDLPTTDPAGEALGKDNPQQIPLS